MLQATRKIYYEDTHLIDFEATILSCKRSEDTGNLLLVLDQSAFFPEEGGQKADAGTLNDIPVLDVQLEGKVLIHILPPTAPETALQPGHTVRGHVDWEQRFDFMQQHTGEHILSGLAHKYYGCNNASFHLGYQEVTMDFDQVLSWDQIRVIEAQANRVIQQNLPITAYFPSQEELKAMEYRSKLDLTEDVRIVDIQGVDLCACCAPHADSTGQVGLLKVVGLQNHRGGVRLNILCGMRAFADYSRRQDYLSDLTVLLSAKPEVIGDAVRRLQAESQAKQERINALQAKLLTQKIKSLPPCDATDNDKALFLFEEKMDGKALRNAVNALTETYKGYCGIFSGNDEDGYFYIVGSSTLDCRHIAALLRDRFQAKGGGSERMVQGTILAPATEINKFIEANQL